MFYGRKTNLYETSTCILRTPCTCVFSVSFVDVSIDNTISTRDSAHLCCIQHLCVTLREQTSKLCNGCLKAYVALNGSAVLPSTPSRMSRVPKWPFANTVHVFHRVHEFLASCTGANYGIDAAVPTEHLYTDARTFAVVWTAPDFDYGVGEPLGKCMLELCMAIFEKITQASV